MLNINKVLNEINNRKDVGSLDVPQIDLYMDQVLTLFDKYFPYNENEPRLTKTMINNYAKAGLIKPAVKKKYNRQHIMMIVIICILKRNLSLNEIKELFKDKEFNEEELISYYEYFVLNKFEITRQLINDFDYKDQLDGYKNDRLFNAMLYSHIANVFNEAARKLIENKG